MFFLRNTYYVGAFLLIVLGLYTVFKKRNIIKVVMGLVLIDNGVNIFLVAIGFIKAHTAPIITSQVANTAFMVDPVPQALVLTAIVIGLSVLALALGLAVKIFSHYKTLNLNKIRKLKW